MEDPSALNSIVASRYNFNVKQLGLIDTRHILISIRERYIAIHKYQAKRNVSTEGMCAYKYGHQNNFETYSKAAHVV